MFSKLISVVVFVSLMFVGAYVAPYLLTSEKYGPAGPVNGLFPIAVKGDSGPKILSWREYSKNPAKYEDGLFVGEDDKIYQISETDFITMKMIAPHRYSLRYDKGDYILWAVYSISDNHVVPQEFRYSGVFVVFYGLLFAAIGTWLVNRARKHIKITSNRTAHPSAVFRNEPPLK